jgi:hypothetical protein
MPLTTTWTGHEGESSSLVSILGRQPALGPGVGAVDRCWADSGRGQVPPREEDAVT